MVFDPLDGSSNIDAGISVGSIFGVYAPSEECSVEDMDNPQKMMENCVLNVCQPGSSLLVAGYCLYSSSTVLVLTVGHGTYGFTYDTMVGEFIMSHRDLKVGGYLGMQSGIKQSSSDCHDSEAAVQNADSCFTPMLQQMPASISVAERAMGRERAL